MSVGANRKAVCCIWSVASIGREPWYHFSYEAVPLQLKQLSDRLQLLLTEQGYEYRIEAFTPASS